MTAILSTAGLTMPYDSQSGNLASRSALPMTLTDDRAIAAAAIIGLSSRPSNGNTARPPAIGTPSGVVDEGEE